jgi:adenine-specific DNA-methyltransferase
MDDDLIKFTKCDIFTPDNICKIMTSKLKNNGNLLEPSVGYGNLIKNINKDNYNSIDIYELKTDYLDKIDNKENINKFNCDFLKADIQNKYDNIIMNPPYIKIQDLSINYRKFLKETFSILNSGLIDIYYAFIIKCLNLLNNDGIMIAITPNSYLYNKSSLKLRKYLFDNRYIKEIIDYKDEKIFKNISVYCCITIFTKNIKSSLLYNNEEIFYDDIIKNYSIFNLNKSNLSFKDICKIKNGIATLRDKIFIHNNKLFDEPCWKQITNGSNEKYIIYPYNNGIIIDEENFKLNNPLTYDYLSLNKNELAKRDKGNKKYPLWYAYGRTQSIKYNKNKCIYIPCFINPNNIEKSISINQNILHYGCLCIEPNNDIDINYIISIIIKNIDFIKDNSLKKSGGWINISSRILYEISLN